MRLGRMENKASHTEITGWILCGGRWDKRAAGKLGVKSRGEGTGKKDCGQKMVKRALRLSTDPKEVSRAKERQANDIT